MFKLIESYEENGGKGQIKLACVIKNIIIILLHIKCPSVESKKVVKTQDRVDRGEETSTLGPCESDHFT